MSLKLLSKNQIFKIKIKNLCIKKLKKNNNKLKQKNKTLNKFSFLCNRNNTKLIKNKIDKLDFIWSSIEQNQICKNMNCSTTKKFQKKKTKKSCFNNS